MNYEVVYDVAADGWLPAQSIQLFVRLFLFSLLVAAGIVFLWLRRPMKEAHGGPRSKRWADSAGWLIGTVLGAILLFLSVDTVWSGSQEQSRCRGWLARGEGEVVEGSIRDLRTAYVGRSGDERTLFEVGGATLVFGWADRGHGGFQGSFTSAPDEWGLAVGERVRVTHRERRILRIERVKSGSGR